MCAVFPFRCSPIPNPSEEAKKMKRTPIFPIATETDHYSDYGFDSEVDYVQVLEEARRHKKRGDSRPLDSLHCKLKKPISKDDGRAKKRRRGWWKSALLFWRRAKVDDSSNERHHSQRRANAHWRVASPGPIYATESGGVGRRERRPSAGLLLAAAEVGNEAAAGMAYVSLRDLSPGDGGRLAPPMPIYLVT